MLKIYKSINDILNYWEAWDNGDETATIHFGRVGQVGQTLEIKSELFVGCEELIQRKADKKIADGYAEFDEANLSALEIEYKIDAIESERDITKKELLEEQLDQALGWLGLGHVDDGTIGNGSLKIICSVVDFEIAKTMIEQDLKDTPFCDYSGINRVK